MNVSCKRFVAANPTQCPVLDLRCCRKSTLGPLCGDGWWWWILLPGSAIQPCFASFQPQSDHSFLPTDKNTKKIHVGQTRKHRGGQTFGGSGGAGKEQPLLLVDPITVFVEQIAPKDLRDVSPGK